MKIYRKRRFDIWFRRKSVWNSK